MSFCLLAPNNPPSFHSGIRPNTNRISEKDGYPAKYAAESYLKKAGKWQYTVVQYEADKIAVMWIWTRISVMSGLLDPNLHTS